MNNPVKIILSILLMACLFDMPYSYYQFVRFVSMLAFAYLSFLANEQHNKNEAIIYIVLAILFQPFIKIALGRTLWNIVDIVVGIGLLVTVIRGKKNRNKTIFN